MRRYILVVAFLFAPVGAWTQSLDASGVLSHPIVRFWGGIPQDIGALMVKEALNTLGQGHPTNMENYAVGTFYSPWFWIQGGIFAAITSAANVGVSYLPFSGPVRMALPIAVGAGVFQYLNGGKAHRTWKDLAISSGAYLTAGLGVGAVADALIYPLLFSAGPPGWLASGLYGMVKMGVALFVGERIEKWLRDSIEGSGSIFGGVQEVIEAIP